MPRPAGRAAEVAVFYDGHLRRRGAERGVIGQARGVDRHSLGARPQGYGADDNQANGQPAQPFAQTALALVSMCGAYRRGVDCPFDAANYYGDPSFKEIPYDTPPAALDFAHTHYDHTHITQDANVGFPLGHLRALEAEGIIRRFVDPAISFSGYLPETRQLVKDTAPAAAKRLIEAGAQAALLVPC